MTSPKLLFLIASSTLLLTACASNSSDRRGPNPERGGADRPDRPARTSGTFMQPIAALFATMDQNNDKAVSASELRSGVAKEWDEFGQNPSAIRFSQWSLKTLGSTDASPTFMSIDRDFNGVITETEFAEQLGLEFTRLDKDQNGLVTRSEMIVAVAARSERGGGKGEKGRGGGSGGQGGGGRPQR